MSHEELVDGRASLGCSESRVRHAGSSRATIQLTAGRAAIKLSIRDYGRGLSAETRELPGVGLAGMRERVSELGGTLSVTSTHPGVCIEARLPRHLPR